MSASQLAQDVQTIEVIKDETIDASIHDVFEAVLEQMGSANETPDGSPLPMVLEAWPGGRWLRDLGQNTGHLWGHVQSIKPPTLLEIYGPLFMSNPSISNVQYRLTAEGQGTRLQFTHRMMGLIPDDVRQNVGLGWSNMMDRIRASTKKRRQ